MLLCDVVQAVKKIIIARIAEVSTPDGECRGCPVCTRAGPATPAVVTFSSSRGFVVVVAAVAVVPRLQVSQRSSQTLETGRCASMYAWLRT